MFPVDTRGNPDEPVERRREVEAILNGVIDPCSAAAGLPMGIVEMGIVEDVTVSGGTVAVRLLPTSPTCLFTGLFEHEVKARLERLTWCTAIEVRLCEGDVVWDENRLSSTASMRLTEQRRTLATSPDKACTRIRVS